MEEPLSRSIDGGGVGAEAISTDANPLGALPSWVQAVEDGENEDEIECHICCLTADDTAEELIVPCLCVSLPCHPTCLESWRMQCRNPDSAFRCATCHQTYTRPSPRSARATQGHEEFPRDTDAVTRMVSPSNLLDRLADVAGDGRLGVSMRRASYRAQRTSTSCLPPADPTDITRGRANVTFCFCSLTCWIFLWSMCSFLQFLQNLKGHKVSARAEAVYNVCYYVIIYGTCVSATGYFATRFLNWPLMKLYVYGLTFQLVASLLILIFQAIMNLFTKIVWNNAYGFSYLVSIAGIVHVVGGLWIISALANTMDPSERRRETRRAARREARSGQRAAAYSAEGFTVHDSPRPHAVAMDANIEQTLGTPDSTDLSATV